MYLGAQTYAVYSQVNKVALVLLYDGVTLADGSYVPDATCTGEPRTVFYGIMGDCIPVPQGSYRISCYNSQGAATTSLWGKSLRAGA